MPHALPFFYGGCRKSVESSHNTLKTRIKFRNPSEPNKMARLAHYSPPIRRELVRVLYHERVRRQVPMTRLVESILTDALKNTGSWRMMEDPPAYQPSVQEKS